MQLFGFLFLINPQVFWNSFSDLYIFSYLFHIKLIKYQLIPANLAETGIKLNYQDIILK